MGQSYRLVNRRTGMPLTGYKVLSAEPEEIALANQRLQAHGSDMRFIHDLLLPSSSYTQEAELELTT